MLPELTKIDAISFVAGVEEALQVKGQKVGPQSLDVSKVSYTYDLNNAFTYSNTRTGTSGNVSVSGSANGTIPVCGPMGYAIGGVNAIIRVANTSYRILGLEMVLNLDAAGAAAMAGKNLQFQLAYMDIVSAGAFTFYDSGNVAIAGGTLQYIHHPQPGFWKGLVPYETALRARAVSMDGTAWPANTTMGVTVALQSRARGGVLGT